MANIKDLAKYCNVSISTVSYALNDSKARAKYLNLATSQEEIKRKNIQTNKETSKRWRDEFKELFGRTPESFRKYGKLQESLDLFKKIKNVRSEEQLNEINRFMESINL